MTIRPTTCRQYSQSFYLMHRLFFAVMLICLAVGCSSQAVPRTAPQSGVTTEQQLRMAADQWLHTPYQMGGQDRRHVDCSGLVSILFRDLFDRNLPRTTRQMAQQGVSVKRGELKAGDLVFFRPPNKVRHVGVYLGSGEFLHATTRRGVIVSNLADAYWRRSYWTARRILES